MNRTQSTRTWLLHAPLLCLAGLSLPAATLAMGPGGGGKITDCNSNGVDDANDISSGTSQDCNANSIPDECDIANGTELDGNNDGIPDSCSPFTGCVSDNHIFLYEDTNGVFADTNHTFAEENGVLLNAINQLLLAHGDRFDFIVFATTEPIQSVDSFASAYAYSVVSDVSGIGNPLYDRHQLYGIAGTRLSTYVQMYNLDRFSGANADLLRNRLLAEEFSHRWNANLPSLADGRELEDLSVCDRGDAHWTPLFNQGAAATAPVLNNRYNSQTGCWEVVTTLPDRYINDDTGGFYSVVELYTMGIISPSEVDSMRPASDRVYFDGPTACQDMRVGGSGEYCGPTSSWSISDIVATAGTRNPDYMNSPKDFNIGWVLIHQPRDKQSRIDTLRAAMIRTANTWTQDWSTSTLGRSTVNSQLFVDNNCDGSADFDDCNGNGIDDATDISMGTSSDTDMDGVPDECIDSDCASDTNDCNANGTADACDLTFYTSLDCNSNGIPDECDIASGTSNDCGNNGVPDECEGGGDCNNNGICDQYEMTSSNDCNGNGILDVCDISSGTSSDTNSNSVPDECETSPIIAGADEDHTHIHSEPEWAINGDPCDADFNRDGVVDTTDLADFFSYWSQRERTNVALIQDFVHAWSRGCD